MKRGMKKGFTLIELMVAIAAIAVLVALLLPDIQKAKDASLKGTQKDGPYWVYREYEFAGGPATTEISGSYKHSLQEILDMYAINLKKQQLQNARELQAIVDAASTSETQSTSQVSPTPSEDDSILNPLWEDDAPKKALTKEQKIKRATTALNNFKFDLSQNSASLVARRNLVEAIGLLEADLKKLEAQP
tara:strand:+ start:6832 stop:7401 length:570 start_codon:yes stop_codon:yes gene_type:complete